MFSNIAQIVTMDFCNFCMKMCYRELSKTAQSGHTGPQFRLSALTGSLQTWKAFSLSLSYFPSKFIFPFSNILFHLILKVVEAKANDFKVLAL